MDFSSTEILPEVSDALSTYMPIQALHEQIRMFIQKQFPGWYATKISTSSSSVYQETLESLQRLEEWIARFHDGDQVEWPGNIPREYALAETVIQAQVDIEQPGLIRRSCEVLVTSAGGFVISRVFFSTSG